MKHSIRFKMTGILILITGSVFFITWILINSFSSSYYVSTEKASIVKTFEKVKKQIAKESSQRELNENLEQISNNTNIKMMICKSSNYFYGQVVVFSNLIDGSNTYEQILGYLDHIRKRIIFNEDKIKSEEFPLKKFWEKQDIDDSLDTLINKGYYMVELKDHNTGQNGIYLFGFTDNDYLIAMRVSIEGIKTTAQVSSRFMAYMGGIGILIGCIIIFIYSSTFTKPIKDMAIIANRMTELDFDAKIHLDRDDELGELGSSMNQLSSTLEATIGDLKSANMELQKDIEKKEEVDEIRKEFLSHVSHELKTPIALIQGYAEGLMEGINDDEESRNFYCEVIVDEAKKMNTMVRNLLALNQLEFGNNQLNIVRFDISQMIQNKINSSKILFSKSNTNVVFEEDDPVYVWADEFSIEEVFSNYFSNALNHVSENGVIRIWYEKQEKNLRVHVYNDGELIPEEELDKLWIKFYKVDKARTREYGGNGIGLSIVAATMKAHGKDFGVSNQSHGVDFYFDVDC